MQQTHRSIRIAVLATALVLGGCGGPVHFVDPEADIPFYQKVAVVPFTTLAQDRAAGFRVTDVFFTEALGRDFAEILEPGQFAAAMVKLRGGTPSANPWSTEDLARLGEATGVQAFFMGTVREYEMVRVGRGSFPLISLEVRLVDAATGRIVWTASTTRRGGPGFPLFGWGEVHTLGELTEAVCRRLLETLP